MIKEYIMELKTENREKLNGLEKQMKDLLNDLDGAKEWMETLQTEKNVDTNIFSPRVMDTELEGKLEEAKNNIQKINRDIDYVKSFIEEGVAKNKEYEKLLEELEQTENTSSEKQDSGVREQDSEIQRHDLKEKKPDSGIREQDSEIQRYDLKEKKQDSEIWTQDSEVQEQNLGVQGQSSKKQSQSSEEHLEGQKRDSENQEQSSEVQKHDLENQEQDSKTPGSSSISAKFLAELYKKTELCLDLLYNDRSRCKSELKNMKTMIKNAADSLHETR